MAWWNPSTWTAVDNLQGQNRKQPAKSPYYDPSSVAVAEVPKAGSTSLPARPYIYGVMADSPVAGGGAPSYSGGGGQSAGSTAAAAAAAAAAAQQAKIGQNRSIIQDRIKAANQVFQALFGDIDAVIRDRTDQTVQQFGREKQGITDQFNEDIPNLGKAYSARGLGSSDYRTDAEGRATRQFEGKLSALGTEERQALAEIGGFGAQSKADLVADQGSLGALGARSGEIEDVNQLLQIRDTVEAKIRDLEAKRGGLRTQGEFINHLNTVAPLQDRVASLRSSITSLVNGNAPRPLKDSVANALIGNSGLGADVQQSLLEDYRREADKKEIER